MIDSTVALFTHLRPIESILNDPQVSEISINSPGEVWFHKHGKVFQEKVPTLSFDHLKRTADLVASHSKQEIGEKRPLLSASLPGGYRIQFVLPPACRSNTIVASIRKQVLSNRTLEDYQQEGYFDGLIRGEGQQPRDEVKALFEAGKIFDFLSAAVVHRKNILISGGTDSGKTTFLRACVQKIPDNERIITIEDAEEVRPSQPNHVPLLFSRNDQGISNVTPQSLLVASLRLRPDRLIYGELREGEAFDFLRAVNTGHSGSMTTVHANSVELAFQQMALMVLQAGIRLSRDEVIEYIKSVIDVVVQVSKTPDGKRTIEDIQYFA